MKASICIATYNRPKQLLITIQEVLRQKSFSAVELLVIDQTPWENIEEIYRSRISALVEQGLLIYIRRNKPNLPAARNHALSVAKGDVVIWIDDDVLLPDLFVENHLKNYEDKSVVAVGGLNYDRLNDVNIDEINLESIFDTTKVLPKATFVKYHDNFNDLVGANHSVRREIAYTVKYDSNFIGYYEDTDFALRLSASGYGRIVCDPDAWLVHLRAPTGGCRINKKNRWKEYLMAGPYILFRIRHNNSKYLISETIRVGPLRKENVVRFWRQPYAWFSYFYAIIWAFQRKHRIDTSE